MRTLSDVKFREILHQRVSFNVGQRHYYIAVTNHRNWCKDYTFVQRQRSCCDCDTITCVTLLTVTYDFPYEVVSGSCGKIAI